MYIVSDLLAVIEKILKLKINKQTVKMIIMVKNVEDNEGAKGKSKIFVWLHINKS